MIKAKISITIITCMLTLCSCTCCTQDVSEEERNKLAKQEIRISSR
ncbi:hypothetical protein Megpolyxen_01395 [Candidatus Megaera polyxenophila]|nr:hypothetical protein Megpolyxen_01395 [Candidatus Megaera polyxenophila]